MRTLTQFELDRAGLKPEVMFPDIKSNTDFTSPAVNGVNIDPQKMLFKRTATMGVLSSIEAHKKLETELQKINEDYSETR